MQKLVINIKCLIKGHQEWSLNLDKTISYSKYIAENVDKSISYSEYVAENVTFKGAQNRGSHFWS